MPPPQIDSKGRKNLKTGASGRPRVSRGMILLGAALLACALALYLYASSNTPHNYNDSDNLDNINRSAPGAGAGDTRPTPDASAQPSKTPEQKGDARTTR